MPQSRHRHKHSHHHSSHAQPTQPHKAAPKRSAVTIMVVFIGLLGIFIAFIAAGSDIIWLLAGALAGGIVGYFIGHSMDRLSAKK